MYYYEVCISSPRYHKAAALTYHFGEGLAVGSVVIVSLQAKPVVGFIQAQTSKPSFKTQLIERVVSKLALPPAIQKLSQWLTEYYPAPSGLITA